MDREGLGDYRAFRAWSGLPRPWGPSDAPWRVWFGGRVIDGLCDVLDEFLATRSRRGVGSLAAIGCVPWLTNESVVGRLTQLAACCVAVDKGAYLPRRLVEEAAPFPNVLPRLRLTVPAGSEEPVVLGPSSRAPEHEVGPVRVVGWMGNDLGKPLLHAKLLVLGELRWEEYGPGPYVEERRFVPRWVWWGSANWTRPAQSHLEVGFCSDDDQLVDHVASFVEDVIAFSEPVGSTCAGPEPNLLAVEFDDEAMAEAAHQQWLDHFADEEDQG